MTVSKGLEELLRQELFEVLKDRPVQWNDPKSDRGGIGFSGDVEDALRVCLHSRVATRVYLKLHEFEAPNPEKLYGGVRSIRWRDHFTNSETFAIDFVAKESQIAHTQFGALKSKDAIVDLFRATTGERPSIDVQNPDIQIQIYLNRDIASVNLDLSGRSLHERGYRKGFVDAPLKENLGAALLMLSGWKEICESGGSLLDPMCGSGTFAIEAAWMAKNRAPGILRERWGFQKWKLFDESLWKRLVTEAKAQERDCPVSIFGSDENSRAYHQAVLNAEAAGVAKEIHFERREMASWSIKPAEKGLFIVNPPYGERLGDEEALIPLYRSIGDTMKKNFPGWRAGIFTGNSLLAKEVGLKAGRRIPVWNGSIECRLQLYELFQGSKK